MLYIETDSYLPYLEAMENWGLLTFRELAVLTDPKKTSKRLETLIALVIAHEAAHLWFGNLVTMVCFSS